MQNPPAIPAFFALSSQKSPTRFHQDPSKFAGAAQQLTGAIIVNPNDKLEVAEAIRDALQMGHQERVARWQSMIGPLRDRDVSWWAAAFLKELAAQQSEARRQKNLASDRLRSVQAEKLAPPLPKKGRKRIAGQTEMLLQHQKRLHWHMKSGAWLQMEWWATEARPLTFQQCDLIISNC